MSIQTWVARFVVDHGQVTEEGGRLRSFPRRRLDEPEADLHVLAEPLTPAAEPFAAQAIDAIGRAFVRDNLSLTGGLVRSLAATHQTLVDWNRRSLPKDQVALGISAAVVVGSTVYLAQVGPGLVYLLRQGVLVRLDAGGDAASALGEARHAPLLRRVDLSPGDLIVAASRSLESLVEEETLREIIARGSDEALPQLYLRTRNQEHFALFAVTCFRDPEAEDEPASAAPAPEPARRSEEAPPPLNFQAQEEPSGGLPRLTPPRPLDISRPVVRLRPDQGSGRGLYTRPAPPRRFGLPLPLPNLIVIGGVFALVVFVAAFTIPDLVRETRGERSLVLTQSAHVRLVAAADAADAAQRRALLEEARRLATEAARLDPANLAAEELRLQATTALEAMNAVYDLGPMQTLVTLSRQLTGEVSVESLLVAQGRAFLLDTRGRRVLSVPLAGGAPTVLFEDGATYGGTPAKAPQFMAWDAKNARLLVLDIERKLFELPNGVSPRPLLLRRSASWSSVTAIAAYDGNLYVLDPRGNRVHRYLPAAAGYDSEPEGILGQAPLANATGLAIDGDVFVAYADGRVRRFSGGVQVEFPFRGIDRPLVTPRSLGFIAAENSLLIADTGNKRVVVVDRDGNFVRQLVSTAFTDLRAVATDAGTGQLYALVGDSLLSATMLR